MSFVSSTGILGGNGLRLVDRSDGSGVKEGDPWGDGDRDRSCLGLRANGSGTSTSTILLEFQGSEMHWWVEMAAPLGYKEINRTSARHRQFRPESRPHFGSSVAQECRASVY